MADFSGSFNKLLEQYLFRGSLQVIDLADTETQTRLIDLIYKLHPASGVVEEKLPGQDNHSVTTEWEQVLDKAIDHQSIYSQWLVCVTRDRARRQEAYITRIEEAIRFTQQQGLLIRAKTSAEAVLFSVIHRNRVILEQQQQHLAVAHRTKKVISDQLNRLISQGHV